MSSQSEFETLQILYQAIIDIDRSINRSREDKFSSSLLEDVINDIKFINKDEFGENYVLPIVNNIRAAVVELYEEQQEKINNSIKGIHSTKPTIRVESNKDIWQNPSITINPCDNNIDTTTIQIPCLDTDNNAIMVNYNETLADIALKDDISMKELFGQ